MAPAYSEGGEIDENRQQGEFSRSWVELERETCWRRAEAQVRTLTKEEYQEQLRREVREILEHELQKPPEQCVEKRTKCFEKGAEKAQRRPFWSCRTTRPAPRLACVIHLT